ncbi:MAG: hypothetical protein C3F12_07370 [Candidatus Methylomirabilota bacterium]|nr:MAG: hypothetical protein C3F12_07370 [candidate division NC10 bacterium]
MDWFTILTPLLVLPIVILFVFIGCTLNESPLLGVPPVPVPYQVSFVVRFHPSLAEPGVTEFIVLINITPEDGDVIPLYKDGAPDDTQEDQWYLYELETELSTGIYTVQCTVLPGNAVGQIIGSGPCTLMVDGDRQVSFDAAAGAEMLTVTGCE